MNNILKFLGLIFIAVILAVLTAYLLRNIKNRWIAGYATASVLLTFYYNLVQKIED